MLCIIFHASEMDWARLQTFDYKKSVLERFSAVHFVAISCTVPTFGFSLSYFVAMSPMFIQSRRDSRVFECAGRCSRTLEDTSLSNSACTGAWVFSLG